MFVIHSAIASPSLYDPRIAALVTEMEDKEAQSFQPSHRDDYRNTIRKAAVILSQQFKILREQRPNDPRLKEVIDNQVIKLIDLSHQLLWNELRNRPIDNCVFGSAFTQFKEEVQSCSQEFLASTEPVQKNTEIAVKAKALAQKSLTASRHAVNSFNPDVPEERVRHCYRNEFE